jgi:hypothetical protein
MICPGYIAERKFLDEGVRLRRKFDSPVSGTREYSASRRTRRIASNRGSANNSEIYVENLGANSIHGDNYTSSAINRDSSSTGQKQVASTDRLPDRESELRSENLLDDVPSYEDHAAYSSSPSDSPSITNGYSNDSRIPNSPSRRHIPEGSTHLATADSTIPGHLYALAPLPESSTGSLIHEIDNSLLVQTVNSTFLGSRERFSVDEELENSNDDSDDKDIPFLLRHFAEVIGPWYVKS